MAVRFDSADSFNSFFNTSLGRKNTNSANDILSNINLSDYSSIKSGTYRRLLNAYYEKNGGSDISKTDTAKKDSKTDSISNENELNTKLVENADTAKKALDKLADTTYEEGNRSSILKNVKSFVNSYNKIVDVVKETEEKDIITKGKWMTDFSETLESDLKEVGITIDSDKKLSIDEDIFNESGMTELKKIFSGKSSYGYNIGAKIGQISSAALSNSLGNYNENGSTISPVTISTIDTYL